MCTGPVRPKGYRARQSPPPRKVPGQRQLQHQSTPHLSAASALANFCKRPPAPLDKIPGHTSTRRAVIAQHKLSR